MNYISLIEELKKRGSIPGLDAIQGLLEELGHPEDDLKIVHIAGTNGKGSVFAYLSSILADGRNYSKFWMLNHIRGIKPSSHTNFHQGVINLFLLKI